MLLSDRLISDNTIKNLYKSANHSKKPVYYDEEEDDDDNVEIDAANHHDGDDSDQDGDDEDEKCAHNEKSATTNSYSVDASLKSHSKNKSLSSSISSTSTSSYSSSISTHNNLTSNLYEFKSDTFDKKQQQQQQPQQTKQPNLIKPIAYLPKENPSYFSSLKPSPESKTTAFLNKNVCSSTNDITNSKTVRNNVPSQQASKLIDRLLSAQEDNSSNKQSTSLSYTCQAYNSSRLSSYDNHDFKEALANIQSLNQNNCNNSTIDKMLDNYNGNNFNNCNEVQNSSLKNAPNNNGTLQPNLIGKYGRKRASIAFPTIANQTNAIKHGSSSALFSSNKSTSSTNIFARALNYAKKSSSSSSSSTSTNNQNKSTWKNKLSKYLSNSSSKSNGLNKRADSQEGCDIIIDEDMFSSYHLSRRHPSSVFNVSTHSTATSNAINNPNNTNNTFNTSTIKSNSNMTNEEMNNAFKNSTNRKKSDEEKKKTKSKSLIADMIDLPKKAQESKSDHSASSSSSTAGFFSTNTFTNKSIINNGFNSLRKILKFNTNSNTHSSKNDSKYKTKQFASTSVLSVPNLESSTDLANNKISKANVKRETLTLDELKSTHTPKSSTNSSMSTSLSIPNETSLKQQQQNQQTSQNLNSTTSGKQSTPFSSPSTSSASTYSSKNHSTSNNENLFQALSCIDAAIDASINKLSVKNNSNSKLFDSCKPIKSISIFNNKKDSSESNATNSTSNNINNNNNNKPNSVDNNLNKSNSKTFCFKKNLLLNNQFSCIKNDNAHNYFNDNSTQSTSTLSASYVKAKPSLIDNVVKSKQIDNLNSNSSSSTCYQQSTKTKSHETNEKFPFNKTEMTHDVNKSKPMTDDDLLCDLEVASFFDRYNSAIHYEDSNYVDNYDDDLQTFDAFQHPNDTNKVDHEFFVDSNMNSAYMVQNKTQTNNIKKKLMTHDDELENLDYLVRQLAVEANLTNLANSSVFTKATVPFQKHQQPSKNTKKCNNYDNANLNTFISDLDVEHLVDDLNKQLNEYSHKDVDSLSDEDNQEDEDELDDEDDDDDDDEENEDLETDNDSIEFDKIIEIFDTNPISNGSDYSTTTNTRLNNTTGKKFDSMRRPPVEQTPQPCNELKSVIDETKKYSNQSRHKRSLSTVSNNSITVKPHFSTKLQFNNNYSMKPKENNKPNKFNSSLTIYPQTPSKVNNSSNNKSNTLQQAEKHIIFNKIQPLTDFNFNNIKIEKKIKLNYRKPQNLNSLLNFGTLC